MKKISLLCIAICMICLGTAYGSWTDKINISGDAATGCLNLKIDKAIGMEVRTVGECEVRDAEIATLLYNEKGEPYLEIHSDSVLNDIKEIILKYSIIPGKDNTVKNVKLSTRDDISIFVKKNGDRYDVEQRMEISEMENEGASYSFEIPLFIEQDDDEIIKSDNSYFTYGAWVQQINITGCIVPGGR